MKKAILYIAFIVLFFSNSQLHATTLSQSGGVKNAIHKIQNKKRVNDGFSKKGSFSHKAELFNDYDDDFDEQDVDDHQTSVAKLFFVTDSDLKINSLAVNFISKSFCDKVYTSANFSRLPRFNYISLRIFRI